MIKLYKKDNEYIAEKDCNADYKHLLDAGFAYNGTDWHSPSITRASIIPAVVEEPLKGEIDAHKRWLNHNLYLNNPEFKSKIEVPMPEGCSLFEFQKTGIEYLVKNKNALLSDEMGLGKTIQAIGLINYLKLKDILIICPASLKLNWRNELNKWLLEKLDVHVVYGKDWLNSTPVVIINYDVLKQNLDALKSRKWSVIIADECHAIKNSKAQRTRAFLKLQADRKIMITGTPILNRPAELWNVLKFIDGDLWTNWYGFAARYCDMKKAKFGMDVSGSSNIKELSRLMKATSMIRRMKSSVLTQMPKKLRQVIEFPCADKSLVITEVDLYNKVVQLKQNYEKAKQLAEVSSDPSSFKVLLQNLREERFIEFSKLSQARKNTAIYKLPAVIEHLASCIESGKVVCFAHHREVIEAIYDAFRLRSVVLYGGTQDRQSVVERFQKEPMCKLFIGSIKAAGVGITLTSSHHVVFAEQDWSPGWMTQCEDRTDRIGQTSDHIFIQHLVLEESIDAMMSRKLAQKQEVIDIFSEGIDYGREQGNL